MENKIIKVKISGSKFGEWEEVLSDQELIGYDIRSYLNEEGVAVYVIHLIKKDYGK